MDADKLVKEFLAEHVDHIMTDSPQSTIIINTEHENRDMGEPQEEWLYLIKPHHLAIEY